MALIAVLSASLSLGMWIYDSKRQAYAAVNEDQVREIQALRDQVSELENELTKMRALAGSGENSLQIERATQRQLSLQFRALEAEAIREAALARGAVIATGSSTSSL